MKQNKFIPELRFPGFEGEWEEKKLREISSSYSGGTPVTTKKEFYGGSIPFIRSAEINKETTELFLTQEGLNKSSAKIVNKGNVLFALYGANSGDVAISKIDGAINQAVLCLRTDYSNLYIYHFLTSRKDWIISKYIQGGQGNLSGEIVKSILIPFPSKLEQQKIADCLSSLDTLIDGHNKRLELLQEHKKGLMQQLFPQEGEKLPRLRFPEFDGEWIEKELGNIGSFIGGGTPNTSVQEFWNGDILWYTPTEVKNGTLKESARKISELGLKNSSAKLLPKGTILITTRATIGDVAITQKECTTNQGFQSLVVYSSDYNWFWYYWIKNNTDELIRKSSGSTFKEIGKHEIKSIMTFSPSKPEQQKIADCLSSLDNLIEAEERRIEQLQLHKKGLMQKLFPVIND